MKSSISVEYLEYGSHPTYIQRYSTWNISFSCCVLLFFSSSKEFISYVNYLWVLIDEKVHDFLHTWFSHNSLQKVLTDEQGYDFLHTSFSLGRGRSTVGRASCSEPRGPGFKPRLCHCVLTQQEIANIQSIQHRIFTHANTVVPCQHG